MKAFVTGGTGFIGSRVVRKLIERGYDVHALARSDRTAAALEAAGARAVRGDITDPASMREGMHDSDVVFHMAAWYKIGSRDWKQAEEINGRRLPTPTWRTSPKATSLRRKNAELARATSWLARPSLWMS